MSYKKLNYPIGSILVDVRYYKRTKNCPECFEVIYWNPLTRKLELQYEDPTIDIWFLKEENRSIENQIAWVEQKYCYPVYCKPSQIPAVIAQNIGGEYREYYEQNKDQMNSNDLAKEMCKCPWVFKADFEPSVYFRLRWLKQFGEECDITKVTYAFLDIEVDVLDKNIDIKDVHDVTQPVNAVTIILPHVKICAVLILGPRPKNALFHPKYYELLDHQEKEFKWLVKHQVEFKRQIVEDDDDNLKYLKGYDIRLHVFPFEQEINLIKTAFDYINKYKPMFCLSWNAIFDDNYLMNRISYLGYDPRGIIIPKEFKTDKLYYNVDKQKQFSFKTSRDWWFTSTYTTYLCQLRLFAAIRKSQSEPRSYSLSATGKTIAGIDKLTQTKSGAFRQFAYTDFLKFILYNIRDVVVQLAIESKVNDCQSLLSRAYMFSTSFSKCFQETHIVRNVRESCFEDDCYVQACRMIVDESEDHSFKGSFVADTALNAPTGEILNGKRINNMMYAASDADAEAYYPNTKIGTNQDPMTMLYKMKIDNRLFVDDCVNRSMNQEYIWYTKPLGGKPVPHDEDMSGPILNSFKQENEMSLLYNWFNLPSVTEYFEFIDSMI